jgi:hypothetical protein
MAMAKRSPFSWDRTNSMDEVAFYRLGPMDHVPAGDPSTLGERKLIARFLGMMVSNTSSKSPSWQEEALEWFFREEENEDDPEPFGLLWCVGALWPDIDSSHMREMFRASTAEHAPRISFRTEQG